MIRTSNWLPLTVAVFATASLGAVLGYASTLVYVIGLGALAMGLTAAAAVSIVSLMSDGGVGRGALAQAAVAIAVGWLVGQAAEDRAFVDSWTRDYAGARQAAAGVEPADGLGGDELAFYVDGADDALRTEMQRVVGFDGPLARWLFRADAGVRLIGPAPGGRGLPVGRVGALIWVFLELLLAGYVARAVLRRVRCASEHGEGVTHDS